jgi:hypothetical protein
MATVLARSLALELALIWVNAISRRSSVAPGLALTSSWTCRWQNVMTTRPWHSACAAKAKPTASGPVPDPRPDGFAVSPDIEPVPVIYVPRSPEQASAPALAKRAAARAGRLVALGRAGCGEVGDVAVREQMHLDRPSGTSPRRPAHQGAVQVAGALRPCYVGGVSMVTQTC